MRVLINKLDAFITANGKPHRSVEEQTTKDEDKWLCQLVSPLNSPRSELNSNTKINKNKTLAMSPAWSGVSPYSSSSGSASPGHSSQRSLSPPLSEASSPMACYSPVCSISDEEMANPDSEDDDDRDDYVDNDTIDVDNEKHSGKLFSNIEGIGAERIDVSFYQF